MKTQSELPRGSLKGPISFNSGDGGSAFGGHSTTSASAATTSLATASAATSLLSLVPRVTIVKNQSVWRDYKATGRDLGNGGSCVGVKEAIRKETGELVAIKTIAREGLPLRGRIDLRREICSQAAIDHPNVARLEGVYQSKQHVRLVMEHLSGGTIWDVVKESGPLSESDARIVIGDTLSALEHMHGEGIVHRDVKLENLVYESERRDKVKLIDLGLCGLWEEGMAPLVRVCGTLEFIAPEVLTEAYTSKCDLWCVGVVAHMLLTGQTPGRIQRDSTVELSPRLAYCSVEAQKFVAELLSVNPEVRPSAAEALQHDWLHHSKHRYQYNNTATTREAQPTVGCSSGSSSAATSGLSGQFSDVGGLPASRGSAGLRPAGRMRPHGSLTVVLIEEHIEEEQSARRNPLSLGAQPASSQPTAGTRTRWRIPSLSTTRIGQWLGSRRAAMRARVAPEMTQILPGGGER